MNKIQLYSYLGGGDPKEGKAEGDHYIMMTETRFPQLAVFNEMTNVNNYIFLEHLLEEKNKQSWEDRVEKELTVNVWEDWW